jgi:hypothetical protein
MRIKNTSAKNACGAFDLDCAPPIPCELEKGHEGEHQWTGIRTVPKPHSEETEEKEFTKTFRIVAPAPVPEVAPATPALPENVKQRGVRVEKILAGQSTNNSQPS